MLHEKNAVNLILKALVDNHPNPCTLALLQVRIDMHPRYIASELNKLEREERVIVEHNRFGKLYRPIPEDVVANSVWPGDKMSSKSLMSQIDHIFDTVTITFNRAPRGVYVPINKWAKLIEAAGSDWDK